MTQILTCVTLDVTPQSPRLCLEPPRTGAGHGGGALTNKNDVVGIYSARGSKGNVRFALGLPPQTPPVPECNGTRIGGRQGRDPIPTYGDSK